jgi:hypothetical protein
MYTQSLIRTASWVIVNKATRYPIFETFNRRTAAAVNTRLYEAIPILQYLQSINKGSQA